MAAASVDWLGYYAHYVWWFITVRVPTDWKWATPSQRGQMVLLLIGFLAMLVPGVRVLWIAARGWIMLYRQHQSRRLGRN